MNFGEGYIFDSEDSFIVLTYRTYGSMKIDLYSLGKRNYEEIKGKVDEIFKDYKRNINLMRYYYTDKGMSFTDIKFDKEEIPGIGFYSILGKKGYSSVAEYYKRFLELLSNILLLLGTPGTGKTTFLKGLLSYGDKGAVITYEEECLLVL